jgi:hypothetical protein
VNKSFSKLFLIIDHQIRFNGQPPDNEVVILFLHLSVRYWPVREYGIFSFCIFIIEVSHSKNSELVTGYPRSSMNHWLEKIIPFDISFLQVLDLLGKL